MALKNDRSMIAYSKVDESKNIDDATYMCKQKFLSRESSDKEYDESSPKN